MKKSRSRISRFLLRINIYIDLAPFDLYGNRSEISYPWMAASGLAHIT